MIVPMKKVALIIRSEDADSMARELRSLGVVHVEHQRLPQGEEITRLKEDLNLLDSAINILSVPELSRQNPGPKKTLSQDWHFIAHHIVDLEKRLRQLEEYSLALKARISQWQRWGDFQPEAVEQLRQKGIDIRLYEIPQKELKGLPTGLIVEKIFAYAGTAGCVTISQGKAEIPFKEISLPKMGLEKMRTRLYEDGRMIEIIRDDLCKYLAQKQALGEIRENLAKQLELSEAVKGMADFGRIIYLKGYLPFDKEMLLRRSAERNSWGLVVEDPSQDDQVPTLLRNPGWVSIIKPVFRLIEIIPGYRELDISPLFLCFLGLFFGMIIGDAGYGGLYFGLTFLAQKKFFRRASDEKVFFLFYFFSACAILWGLLTGTVFGQEWYLKAGLKPFVPALNDSKFLQAFCFFIGALHLTLAHLWQGVRKLPSLAAAADSGWICILWAAFFLAKALILSDPFPIFARWLIISGVALVVFCSSPQRNILKMIAQGLGTLALSLVNNFTDVVSYVRLFAVGMAGIAISDTVNTLAFSLGGGNIIAKTLIIFLGHGINLVLGPLSVLVHGIRLNVLEFSGHANLSWSGSPYKPLRS